MAVPPPALLRRYVAAYRKSLVEDGLMCLCGLFGAEIAHLPRSVAAEARRFFEANLDWLVVVIERRGGREGPLAARAEAMQIVATLEGALILARSLDDPSVFDAATQTVAWD